MNFTRRIIKFMLVAAIALPAWHASVAQNNSVPPKLPDQLKLESESRHKNQPRIIRDAAQAPQNETVSNEPQIVIEPQQTVNSGKRVAHMASRAGGNATMLKTPLRADAVTVTPPASATIEAWDISTTWTYYTGSAWSQSDYNTTSVQVAFDGNDVYIQGLCYWIPGAWVKGTLNADQTQVTFLKNQYYGILEQDGEEIPIWFLGLDGSNNIIDVVFAYDKNEHKLTLNSNTIIFDASDADSDTGSSYHSGTVISKPVPSAVIADGEATNAYLPVYGYYFENTDGRYQMVYPAGLLSELEGRKIKTITFHTANTAGITFGNPSGTYGTGDLMLTLGTTNDDNYGNSATLKTLSNTATSTITPTYGADHMTFTFEDPYEYVAGTNLIMQTQVTEQGTYAQNTTFQGITTSQNQSYYKYSSSGTATVVKFLPKVTFTFDEATAVETDELDFGAVNVGSSKTLSATINNPSDETVTATITTAAPFSVASTTSTTVSLPSGISSVRVTFTPANSISYSGNLAVNMNGTVKNIRLKGVGNMSGPEALRDSAFFAGITYNWTDSQGRPQTSRLDEIATEPAQIIAMMKEIYTNKEIPGNLKRGFSAYGNNEVGNVVNYPGVGTISHTGSSYSTGYSYEDGYGWNIPGNLETPVTGASCIYNSYSRYADYCYMDSLQYQPHYDGVTLLLVEMVDTFSYANVTAKVAALPSTATDYQKLFTQMKYTVKSARIVTQAKRTGTDFDKGTLFKIDCDKMNKFFLLAKGQVRRVMNSYFVRSGDYSAYTSNTYRPNPAYFRIRNSSGTTTYYEGFTDTDTGDPFYHMFEQFSPVTVTSAAGQDDVYQSLVNMQSFGVQHDCMGISHMNHQFMMYGEDSNAEDCQDVRDLMFFVPDYRMMNFGDINNYVDDETNRDRSYALRYLNYHRSHQPKMGLYVIRQDSITTTTEADDYYMLDLHWRTNLDDFMPSDEQEFYLYEVVTDEDGTHYEHVYYRNANGEYTDAQGNVLPNQDDPTTWVPIVLQMEVGQVKSYPYVYVEREASSKEVTYAIQGCDTGHFLSLQMSNQMSYIIPGTDPNELIAIKDATHYSRFNPQSVKNCYSNKIQVSNNAMGLNNNNITDGNDGTKLFVTRSYMTRVNNLPVSVTDTVATITFNNHSSITVTMAKQSPKSEYPNGKSSGEGAGYHANKGETSWTQTYKVSTNSSNSGNIIFDPALTIFDNFTVDVSNNDHPIGYTYEVKTNYAGQNNATVYSNMFRVPVYKTASLINGSFTKDEVDNDDDIGLSLVDNVEFGTQVQYSSKTEILRYDAYRWNETEKRFIVDKVVDENGDEQDLPPTGIAGNQGGSYTVSMNAIGTDDYTTSTVSVGNGQTAWANFVDPMPKQNGANAYVYAPVVELFTTGKDENNKTRTDYNTYGGPLQNTAFSNLDVSVVTPSLQTPLMSNMSWTDEQTGNKYAWYQIFLNVNTAQVPQGYSLYGIRAWRHVPQNLLGEHPLFPRPDRVPTNDEDIMFEKILEGYDHDSYQVLGSHAADYEDVQNGEVRATFGARKLRTEGGEETGVIDQLNAEFTVRLYFTPAPIYVYANPGGNDIDCNNAVATLYSDDGKTYTGTVTIPDKGDGTGYFVFSKKVGSSWTSNNQNIFGAQWNEAVALVGPQGPNNDWVFNLRYWSGETRSFKITPGTYKFEITNHIQSRDLSGSADYSAGNLKITPVTANAGLRDGAAGATGKFYVAEQELNFSIDSSSDIITGIFDIDGAKQVAGVKYYNVAGIESDKPFDGINIVVTRYSDGSVVTRKEVK